MSLKEQIQQHARSLGFDLVGITTAQAPDHAAAFQQWLAAGRHGEMTYLARRSAERTNLDQVLPGAKSVIVLGMNYYIENSAEPTRVSPPLEGICKSDSPPPASPPKPWRRREGPGVGFVRIARYAWGSRDYHEIIGEKLEQLAAFIRARSGPTTKTRSYVDTGPVLERDLAQRAGLGFIGKHTNLINRGLGNWLFLGEILTTLELPVDRPEKEYCGTCTRCLAACPTRAIVAPYQLDARLCISYLTIELKGSIPVALRPLIGDRVFGCDDCLEVCPWNRFARLSPLREFQRRDLPLLTEFLAWDDRQFSDFFRNTPIHRLKRRGFLRNVCVALGNRGDLGARPALDRAVHDTEPLVREHAAWALEQLAAK